MRVFFLNCIQWLCVLFLVVAVVAGSGVAVRLDSVSSSGIATLKRFMNASLPCTVSSSFLDHFLIKSAVLASLMREDSLRSIGTGDGTGDGALEEALEEAMVFGGSSFFGLTNAVSSSFSSSSIIIIGATLVIVGV